jgi:integrase
MPVLHRLTDQAVRRSTPGLAPDGGGLYLQTTVGARGLNRSWLFRYAVGRKERQMGLGSFPTVSLRDARKRAAEARAQRAAGIDPLDAKASQRAALAVSVAKSMTFDACAKAYHAAHSTGWTPHYAGLWRRSLAQHASPVFGHLPVQAVDRDLVLRVLEPIWTEKPVAASLVRARIEAVLDWGRAHGLRNGENPAAWKGNLRYSLPSTGRVHVVEHHTALPYGDVPGFVSALRAKPDVSARALEVLILTAARPAEAAGCRWDEITGDLWTVPPARMKGRLEHRVPLSGPAQRILIRQLKARSTEFVFPGRRGGQHRSAMDNLLERLGVRTTVHGFRSSFKDWAAETTDYADWVSEKALAHLVGDETRRAYQRGDLLEKRRQLMNDWAAYIEAPG